MTETPEQLAASSPAPSSRRPLLTALFVFLPFIVLALAQVKIAASMLGMHYDTWYPEVAHVYACVLAARTGHLYTDPLALPLNAQMYGPFFYIFGAAVAKLAHADVMLTTVLIRLASLLSLFICAALVGWLTWRLEKRREWTAVAMVLCFSCIWTTVPSASARPDVLAAALFLAALAVFHAAEGNARLTFIAGVLGTLAYLTKQSAATILAALLIETLITRRLKQTLALIAGCLPVPLLLALFVFVRHEPLWANFTIARHLAIQKSTVIPIALTYIFDYQLVIIPIVLATLGALLRWSSPKYRVVLIAVALGCLSNVAALANLGGGSHYLIVPWFLLVLLVPAGMVRLQSWPRNKQVIAGAVAVLFAAFAVHHFGGGKTYLLVPWLAAIFLAGTGVMHMRRAVVAVLWLPVLLSLAGAIALVHSQKFLSFEVGSMNVQPLEHRRVLSDMPYIEAQTAGPQLLDPYLYHQLYLNKVWSPTLINATIDRQGYDLVLLRGNQTTPTNFYVIDYRGTSFWGAEILDDVKLHYRVLCEGDSFLAMVPRGLPATVTPQDIAAVFGSPCNASKRLPQPKPNVL